ncbi:MAG: polysaccharide biosynthesis C-terminal domain-containing protein [Bacteroidales bacterium]|nr:polysaccharide biosynthesis C-terminal domain-containing protein [Bacteroidales bacterium]
MQVSRVFRDIVSVFSSNIFGVLAGLCSGILIARFLGPEGRGIFAALATVPILVLSISALGLRRATLFHIASPESDNNKVISALVILWMFSSVLGMSVAGFMFSEMDELVYTKAITLPVILIIPIELIISYVGGLYLGVENFRMVNRIRMGKPFLFVVLLCISLLVMDFGIVGVAWSYFGASFTVAISVALIARKKFKFDFIYDFAYLKSLLKLGLQFAMAFFVIQLNLRLDILLLGKWSTTDQVGFYSVGVTVAEQLWQLPMAVGIVVTSKTASVESRQEMDRKIGPLLRLSLLAGLLSAFALYLVIPYLLPLVYGAEFIPSISAVRLMLPGVIMFLVFRILNSRLDGFGKPMIGVSLTIPGLILNVILNYFLIPKYGAYGAAVATDISYALMMVLMLFTYSRVAQISLPNLLFYRKTDFQWIRIFLNHKLLKTKSKV